MADQVDLASQRFFLANYLDELLLQHASSISSTAYARPCATAYEGIQHLLYPCLSEPTIVRDVIRYKDTCLILAHAYGVLYHFPLNDLVVNKYVFRAMRVDSLFVANRMYLLTKAMVTLGTKIFPRNALREAFQWLAELSIVREKLHGQGHHHQWLLALFNQDNGIENSDNCGELTRQHIASLEENMSMASAENHTAPALAIHGVFFDAFEYGAVTAASSSLASSSTSSSTAVSSSAVTSESATKEEPYLSLIEAYPYLTCLHNRSIMDTKHTKTVAYMVHHLSYQIRHLESWTTLFQRCQFAAFQLSDAINDLVDLPAAQPFLESAQRRYRQQYQQQHAQTDFLYDTLWKLDPECWMNELIPSVEGIFQIMTSSDHVAEYVLWVQTHLLYQSPDQEALSVDLPEDVDAQQSTVKSLLLLTQLQQIFTDHMQKIYQVFRLLLRPALRQLERKHYHFLESYALHVVVRAKGRPLQSGARRKLLMQVMPVLQQGRFGMPMQRLLVAFFPILRVCFDGSMHIALYGR